jgi:hypothetical protein
MSAISAKAQAKTLDKFMSKYSHKFVAKRGFIDMRTMSKNYPSGVIPCNDLDALVDVLIGPAPVKANSIDPTTKDNYTLELSWELLDNMGILSAIQRDMIPNHIYEIEMDFDSKKISVILAMEDPVTGLICPFDGNHTRGALRRQGWTKAPVFVLRAPQDMIDADPYEARKYLMRIAGEAFLSINLTHKKGVSGYDQFIIKRDYGDPDAVAVSNILIANNTTPVRISKDAGNVSHYPNLWACYDLLDRSKAKGRYLDLALDFHRNTWPLEVVYGATLVGLANFFHKCERAKVTIDQQFFDDLKMSVKPYKLSKFLHEGYKAAYYKANPYGSASDDLVVTCGFVHSYTKHINKPTYTAELQFTVK